MNAAGCKDKQAKPTTLSPSSCSRSTFRAMDARLSNRLQVLEVAISGATDDATKAEIDYRTITFSKHFNRLSFSRVAPGSICAGAPQTGAHKGQLCGMPLDSFGDTHMALAEQQTNEDVCTTRCATVLPIYAAKLV